MADRFKPPDMDWATPGDIHKRFKLFQQKCELIFAGPLDKVEEPKKVRLLLLWIGDKGLGIYNTTTWASEGDNLKIAPVMAALEAYTKPQSNEILARYQLRCLKQGDRPLEEFVTEARLLIGDGGYDPAVRENTLRDTLVFGVASDKVRKDAIALGNGLTFKQVYDLAKVEESTKAQMKIISKGDEKSDLHTVQRESAYSTKKHPPRQSYTHQTSYGDQNQRDHTGRKPRRLQFKSKGCFRCGNTHDRSANCPAKNAKCKHCGKTGHYARVCIQNRLQKVHQIVSSPEYQGQDIHLEDEYPFEDDYGYEYTLEGESEEETSDTEPITVFLGTLTSTNGQQTQEISLNTLDSHPDKIFAKVKINEVHDMNLKVDTGADACVITSTDLQHFPFPITILPCSNVLRGYGGSEIENLGVATLKVSFKDKSANIKFNVVEAPGSPSMLGCRQCQDLGIISTNVDEVNTIPLTKTEAEAERGKLSKPTVMEEYQDCFDKLGCFPGEKYHIQLIDNPVPVVHPPRTVPVHILPLYKEELDKMIADDVITAVAEPTDWVNSIVCNIRETPDGKKKIRLCLDPKDLNKSIRREHYYTRTIDELLPQLHGKKFFSVVDTKKGYWHVALDHESSLLCTFNTPFGRYRFKRLPFGVKLSQDIFQRKLDEVYRGIPNVMGIADDIVVCGSTQSEHDQAFCEMLKATRKHNVSLNSEKLQFKQAQVDFYGHVLTENGIQPAIEKLEAIHNMKSPSNMGELQTILGMVTYLNRFSTKLADLTSPLRELIKKHVHFSWEPHHQQALDRIKQELRTSKLISYYDLDPSTPTILQCDASKTGIGAWLRQSDSQGNEHIVAMASRSLTETESRYSSIERECLAVTYGLEKFEYYLLGRNVTVETDHSPLEQIFKKNINEAPGRLQRLLLRCLRFDVNVQYKPGRSIPVADALSRVCHTGATHGTGTTTKDASSQRNIHFISTPIDLTAVKSSTAQDPTMDLLKHTIYNGWPPYRKQCPQELWEFWNFRCDLTLEDGLVLKGSRIVVPTSMRNQVLQAIHLGHQGENKCILRARESVFWPDISADIRQMVKDCDPCNKHKSAQPRLPILQPDLPTRPWEKLGADIFEFNKEKYLMVVDYYSRFPVIRLLNNMTSHTVCNHFTTILAEYGLPATIVADFGSQFISERFKTKCEQSGIALNCSSPYHHQANSLAERAIGTCKSLLIKALEEKECPYTALWMYRTTPLSDQMPSPHELLFGRKPQTTLPSSRSALKSKHPDDDLHQEANQTRQERQAVFYNRKAGSDRKTLNNREPVFVWNTLKNTWQPGTVLNRPQLMERPRTYTVDIQGKIYQRTREHLRPRCQSEKNPSTGSNTPSTGTVTPIDNSKDAHVPNDKTTGPPQLPDSTPTADHSLCFKPPSNEKQLDLQPAGAVATSGTHYQPKSQVTRTGRVTQVPTRFKD